MGCAKEKTIYIVVSHTNTMVGKAIRAWVFLNIWKRSEGGRYPHSSLSLDTNLDNMMSFGRRKLYMPLIGGLIKEDIRKGVFAKGIKKGKIAIIAIPVTEEQYNIVEKRMLEDWAKREILKYNILAFMAMCFTGKGLKRRNRYTCSHWVAEVLENSNIHSFDKKLWNVMPSDYYDMFKDNIVFEGYIKDYIKMQNEKIA